MRVGGREEGNGGESGKKANKTFLHSSKSCSDIFSFLTTTGRGCSSCRDSKRTLMCTPTHPLPPTQYSSADLGQSVD